jgi:hypothetical protein
MSGTRHGTSSGAMMIDWAGLRVHTGCPPILKLAQRNGGSCITNVAPHVPRPGGRRRGSGTHSSASRRRAASAMWAAPMPEAPRSSAGVPADQDGHQVGGGHAGGRVTGPGRGARPDGVHAELLGEFGGQGEIDVGDWRELDRRARDVAVLLGSAHLGLPADGVRNDATIPSAPFRQRHPWRLTLARAVPGPSRTRAATRACRLYRSPSRRLRCGQGDGAATRSW